MLVGLTFSGKMERFTASMVPKGVWSACAQPPKLRTRVSSLILFSRSLWVQRKAVATSDPAV